MLNRGFTLIELIVVFGTIAFLSVVGIASYVSYSQSQSLQAATQELVTTIQLAKSRANSQVKPPICLNMPLDGYSVVVSIANSTYTLNVVCSDISFPLQTTTLPNNITFDIDKTTITDRKVFFAVISGAVSGSGTIAITGYNQTRYIIVDSIGIAKLSLIPPPTPTPTPAPTSTPTPTPTSTPAPKKVFVISTRSSGNLVAFVKTNIDGNFSGNGLEAGDRICKWRADNASGGPLGGTWIAWLSSSSSDAKDRIVNDKYVRLDGSLVANNKADLIDGTISNQIEINENGVVVDPADPYSWTGTDSQGLRMSNTCSVWTSGVNGQIGYNSVIDGRWTDIGTRSCGNSGQHLYCFEQ